MVGFGNRKVYAPQLKDRIGNVQNLRTGFREYNMNV